MKLNYLKMLDKTPIIIKISDGTFAESGAKNVISTVETKCRFENSSKVVYDSKGAKVSLSAIIYIGYDIAPTIETISGSVKINDKDYEIYHCNKLRNPDGTVCFVKLELM